jgi:hypothetical protein
MRFDSVKKLKGEAFRRLTGVQRSTFEDMVGLLFAAKRRQKATGGKPNTLCIEDQLLMMLGPGAPWSTPFRACALRPLDDDNIRYRLASR